MPRGICTLKAFLEKYQKSADARIDGISPYDYVWEKCNTAARKWVKAVPISRSSRRDARIRQKQIVAAIIVNDPKLMAVLRLTPGGQTAAEKVVRKLWDRRKAAHIQQLSEAQQRRAARNLLLQGSSVKSESSPDHIAAPHPCQSLGLGGDGQGGDEEGGDGRGGDEEGGDGRGGDEEGGDKEGGDKEGGDKEGGDEEGDDEDTGRTRHPLAPAKHDIGQEDVATQGEGRARDDQNGAEEQSQVLQGIVDSANHNEQARCADPSDDSGSSCGSSSTRLVNTKPVEDTTVNALSSPARDRQLLEPSVVHAINSTSVNRRYEPSSIGPYNDPRHAPILVGRMDAQGQLLDAQAHHSHWLSIPLGKLVRLQTQGTYGDNNNTDDGGVSTLISKMDRRLLQAELATNWGKDQGRWQLITPGGGLEGYRTVAKHLQTDDEITECLLSQRAFEESHVSAPATRRMMKLLACPESAVEAALQTLNNHVEAEKMKVMLDYVKQGRQPTTYIPIYFDFEYWFGDPVFAGVDLAKFRQVQATVKARSVF